MGRKALGYPLAAGGILRLGVSCSTITTAREPLFLLVPSVERIHHAGSNSGPIRCFKTEELLHIAAPELVVDTIADNTQRMGRAHNLR